MEKKYRSASVPDVYLSFDEVIGQALDYINENPDNEYNVYVGTDSLYREWHTVFATVVAVHKVGSGGRFWYTKETLKKYPRNLVMRLNQEAAESVAVMTQIYNSKLMDVIPEENFSIHIDVGAKGESHKVINQCVGFVTGQGFHCEYKPDSAIATCVADRITK